jgi:hypothetical protein
MATNANNSSPDIKLLEFERLREFLQRQLQDGADEIRTVAVSETLELSVPKVNEALLHLSRKHDYIEDGGTGRWELQAPTAVGVEDCEEE